MDPTGWEAPSTKRAAEYLRQASDALVDRPLLIVLEDLDSAEALSFRNLPGVYVLAAAELETVDVVAARALLVERSVWERLAGEPAEVEAVEPKPKPKPKPKAKPKPKPRATPPPAPEPVAEETPEPEAAVAEEPAATEPEAPAARTAEVVDAEAEEAPAEEAPADEPGDVDDDEDEADGERTS